MIAEVALHLEPSRPVPTAGYKYVKKMQPRQGGYSLGSHELSRSYRLCCSDI